MGKAHRAGSAFIAVAGLLVSAGASWGQAGPGDVVPKPVVPKPVVPRVQDATWGAESDPDAIRSGDVVKNPAGELRVIAAARFRPEIWKVAADGEVVDVGYFVAAGTGGGARVEWERSPPVEWPLAASGIGPWRRTGVRFDAFRLTDWIVGQQAPVGLPFFGREDVPFEFGKSGGLEVGLKEGGKVSGRWWWSKGRLHVEVEGLRDVATYEWKSLAAKLGWSAWFEGEAVRGPVVAPLDALRRKAARDRVVARARDGCPKDVLHRLLSEAAERSDVVSAIAIEKETIALCAERQSVVADLLKAEGQIEDAVAKTRERRGSGKARKGIRSVAQLVGVDAGSGPKEAAPAVDDAAVRRDAAPVADTNAPRVDAAASGAPAKPERRPATATQRRFSWFSLLGRKGDLVAGVTDGRRVWFVGEGDLLPGNRRVQRIAGHPPGVRVAGLGLLPWAGKAGASGGGELPAEGTEPEPAGGTPETAEIRVPALAGRGRAVDGDTLELGGARVRLWGIDAPEARQRCRASGRWWSCGGLATAALRSRSGNVQCERRGKDAYGRVLAVCFERGEDVNGWLVSEGWALAYRRFATDYVANEDRAREAGKGMHRGAFVNPWDWRRGVRLKPVAEETATQPAPVESLPGAVGESEPHGLPPLPDTGAGR